MLTGVNLLLRLVSTGFQVYLSGIIGAAGIGLLQLVLSTGAMAMTAGIAGIRTACMYLSAEELGKGRSVNVTWVLSGACRYSICFSTAAAVLMFLLAPTVANNWIGHPEALPAIRLLAGFLPVSCLCGVMTGYFTAAKRIGTLAVVEICEQLCSILVTVLALKLWAGADPAKACQAVILGSSSGALLTLLALVILRIAERPPIASRIPIAQRLQDTALPLALADDLKVGINTVENLMVPKRLAAYRGIANPLALFGAVCGMVFPVLMFPAAILFGLTELLIPELAQCNAAGHHFRIQYLMKRSLKIAMLYGTLCACILYLCAEDLAMSLYHDANAGTYLRWFAPLSIMLYCDIVTDSMIKGLGQQKISVRYNIFTSAMDVVLLYFLLPTMGISGYYLSFLITHIINFSLSLRRLIHITKCPVPYLPAIVSILCGILSVWCSSYVLNPWLRGMACSIILVCLLFLTGVLSRKDLRWMKGLIKAA